MYVYICMSLWAQHSAQSHSAVESVVPQRLEEDIRGPEITATDVEKLPCRC